MFWILCLKGSFGNIAMWRDAISQNAWDTGAGAGLFFAYAAYMKRSQGVVKLSIITPLINNVIRYVHLIIGSF